MSDPFINLHLHTEFSFLDGMPTMPALVERVKELGQTAVAVTDHGECSGHLALQRAAQAADIKPIFGLEGYFCPDRKKKEGKKGELYDHMTLVAVSQQGLHNLWALSSRAFMEGAWYGDPRFDWELLQEYNEGLVATGGCLSGNVAKYLNPENKFYNPDIAVERLGRFLEIFEDRFYLELHTFDDDTQKQVNHSLVQMSSEFGVPLIAVCDAHYLRPDDWLDHEIVTAMQMGKMWDDPTRYQYGHNQLSVRGGVEVRERLGYLGESVVDEAIANTARIADPIDASIAEDRSMPVFFEDTKTDAMRIWDAALEGFRRKVMAHVDSSKISEYRERLEYELGIIVEKGFPGYFLIVRDIVVWCKENNILVGPSRGSAGGSLLAYVLDITEIDPIASGLFFERFLDPGRDSLPDIDIDVPQHQRHLVKEYLENKYGQTSIATIGTLNRETPKALLKDLCRVLRVPTRDAIDMSKIIDQMPDLGVAHINTSWPMVYQELKSEFEPYVRKGNADPRYEKLFHLMDEFSGHIRHAGAHAAGVVISKDTLIGRLPLRLKNDDVRTQMEAADVEYLGFVKMDLLGLRTLSTLSFCREMVLERHPDADIADYNNWQYEWSKYYEDEAVFQSLWGGKNIGVFQLETPQFRQIIKWFKPDSIEDLSALISINRPGNTRAKDETTGMFLIDLFRERRGGQRAITYKHPLLEKVLDVTHGNFIYQEQVMEACVVLAGYSLSETDRVRKILGKKQVDKMPEERRIFVEGCKVTNDIDPKVANDIFDEMESFASYGFNKSHAWAYALVGYWCAWMKHHYPREFMTALFLTNESSSPLYQRECQRMNIPILGPDVNESSFGFSLTEGGTIRYGLTRIKNMSVGAREIVDLAPFENVADFTARVSGKTVNKRAAESAIACGALDSLTDNAHYPDWWTVQMCALYEYWQARGDFKPNLPKGTTKTSLGKEYGKENVDTSLDGRCVFRLLDSAEYPSCDTHSNFEHYCDEMNIRDRGEMEKEYLGSLITVDPLKNYMELIASEDTYPGESEMLAGEVCRVGGLISEVRPLVTKRGRNPGQEMCQMFVELPAGGVGEDDDDKEEQVQVVVFPDAYKQFKQKIEKNAPVLVDVEKLSGGGVSLRRMFRLDHLGEN